MFRGGQMAFGATTAPNSPDNDVRTGLHAPGGRFFLALGDSLKLSKSRLASGAAIVCLAWAGLAQAQAAEPAASASTIGEAITGGRVLLDMRFRYEDVDQANLARRADAETLRTRIGWETGEWRGLSGLVEFEGTKALGPQNYNSTVNGKTAYPVVADPEVAELNQLYLAWKPSKAFGAVLGRQVINLDDQRFVGAVAWRQDEQTFDAARADAAIGKVKLSAIWLNRVNRVFGEEADWTSDSWLLHASYDGPAYFKPTAFYYALDFGNSAANSSQTAGLRVTGATAAGPVKLAYAASYARQSDYGSNPASFGLNYWSAELGGSLGIVSVKANYESLGGDGVHAFQTPLATLHAFQGWADVFLTTPANGIEDANVTLAVSPPVQLPHLSKVKLVATYHDFQAQRGGADLGDEVDLLAQVAISKRLGAFIKYADYDGVPGFPSRQKFWFGFEYKL